MVLHKGLQQRCLEAMSFSCCRVQHWAQLPAVEAVYIKKATSLSHFGKMSDQKRYICAVQKKGLERSCGRQERLLGNLKTSKFGRWAARQKEGCSIATQREMRSSYTGDSQADLGSPHSMAQ